MATAAAGVLNPPLWIHIVVRSAVWTTDKILGAAHSGPLPLSIRSLDTK